MTVVQFSGIGSDVKYQPGSGGVAGYNLYGEKLKHYNVELGPVNFAQLTGKNNVPEISKSS